MFLSCPTVYDTYHPIVGYSNYLILGITAASKQFSTENLIFRIFFFWKLFRLLFRFLHHFQWPGNCHRNQSIWMKSCANHIKWDNCRCSIEMIKMSQKYSMCFRRKNFQTLQIASIQTTTIQMYRSNNLTMEKINIKHNDQRQRQRHTINRMANRHITPWQTVYNGRRRKKFNIMFRMQTV